MQSDICMLLCCLQYSMQDTALGRNQSQICSKILTTDQSLQQTFVVVGCINYLIASLHEWHYRTVFIFRDYFPSDWSICLQSRHPHSSLCMYVCVCAFGTTDQMTYFCLFFRFVYECCSIPRIYWEHVFFFGWIICWDGGGLGWFIRLWF